MINKREIEPIPEMDKVDEPIADVAPPREDWEVIHEVADAHEDELVDSIEDARNNLIDGISVGVLASLFLDGRYGAVEDQIDLVGYGSSLGAMTPIFRETVDESARGMINFLPVEHRNIVWNVDNSRSMNWINNKTGRLVKQITDETRLAIRASIKHSVRMGYGADRSARGIRDIVALTGRQARAVDNYKARIVADGFPVGVADSRGREYADRLHRHRAETIARTEIMEASNQGHLELINEGVEQGVLNARDMVRIWILTPDDRLCGFCEAMDGIEIHYGEQFDTPLGVMDEPPMHPNCRCTTAVRFDEI